MTENIWWEKEEENQGKVILPPPREVFSKKGMVNSGQRVRPEGWIWLQGTLPALRNPFLRVGRSERRGSYGGRSPKDSGYTQKRWGNSRRWGVSGSTGQDTRGGKIFVSCWTGETWAGVSAKREKTFERPADGPAVGSPWLEPSQNRPLIRPPLPGFQQGPLSPSTAYFLQGFSSKLS